MSYFVLITGTLINTVVTYGPVAFILLGGIKVGPINGVDRHVDRGVCVFVFQVRIDSQVNDMGQVTESVRFAVLQFEKKKTFQLLQRRDIEILLL